MRKLLIVCLLFVLPVCYTGCDSGVAPDYKYQMIEGAERMEAIAEDCNDYSSEYKCEALQKSAELLRAAAGKSK